MVLATFLLVFSIRGFLEYLPFSFPETQTRRYKPKSSYALHSALNTVLFPPLFFFSALYYTDIPSLFFVLACYRYYIQYSSDGMPPGRPKFTISLTAFAT